MYLKTEIWGIMIIVSVIMSTVIVSLWQIDVAVGAMSVGGCITTGGPCTDPMAHYHHYLRLALGGTIFMIVPMFGMLVDFLELREVQVVKRKNDLSRIKNQIKKEKMHR